MRDPTGKRPKDRPLDYYLPAPRLDQPQPQPSSWQPPGVSASNLAISQASGKFLSAADMYRQDQSTNGYQQYPYAYANVNPSAPRSNQPPRSLAWPTTSPPPQSAISTTLEPRPSHGLLGVPSQADMRRSPHNPPPALPSPTPRRDLHVQTDSRRPQTSGNANDATNRGPSPEERFALGSPHPRQRTISQPNREYRHPQNSPPLVQPDPYSIIAPLSRRANYPNPNDPFSVIGPRGNPLKQTQSNTTDSSHKGCTHACVSLNRTDRMRMIRFPPNIVVAVKAVIETNWPRGIQTEREIAYGAYEFQLKGNPWTGQGDESIPARTMMCEILSTIYHRGWELRISTDISQKAQDKDLLIYREGPLPPPCQFLAISFNDSDRLRIISGSNGPSASSGPPYDVINAIKNVWGGHVQKEQWKVQGVAWEFKLAGSPWWASGEESVQVRMLLLSMLDQLTALGWESHASLDMTAGPGGATRNAGSDTDCWFLKKLL